MRRFWVSWGAFLFGGCFWRFRFRRIGIYFFLSLTYWFLDKFRGTGFFPLRPFFSFSLFFPVTILDCWVFHILLAYDICSDSHQHLPLPSPSHLEKSDVFVPKLRWRLRRIECDIRCGLHSGTRKVWPRCLDCTMCSIGETVWLKPQSIKGTRPRC